MTFYRRQSGFSLVEILLVLGVIALLAIAAFIVFPKVQAQNRANAETQRLSIVVANVERVYNGRYDGLDLEKIKRAKLLAAGWADDPENSVKQNNVWGKSVFACSGGPKSYSIHYVLPGEGCPNMVSAAERLFDVVQINGLIVKEPGTALDVAAMVAACQADDVDLGFTRGTGFSSCM